MKFRLLLLLTILGNHLIGQDWTLYLNHLNSGIDVLYTDTVANELYLGGIFEDDTQPSMHGFATFNNGSPLPITGISSSRITEVVQYNGEFYLGGQVYAYDSSDVYYLVKWNGSTMTPVMVNGLPFNNDIGNINDIRVINNELYIAGGFRFTDVDGNVCNGIAKLEGTEFKAIHHFPRWDYLYNNINNVDEITVYNNEVYVAGRFYDSGPSDTMNGFCKWNGMEWQRIDGIDGPFFGFDDMLEYQGKLYISGTFNTPTANLAVWNGSAWEESIDVLSSETFYPRVRTMEIFNGELYIGGYFDQVAGIYASNFAKFDGNEWCGLTNDTIVGQINDFAVLGSELYIGGVIYEINHFDAWNNGYEGVIAKLNPDAVFTCIDVVGLNEQNKTLEIEIFPNPTNGILELKNASNVHEISIVDVTGKIVKKMKNSAEIEMLKIDISDLPDGFYSVLARSKQQTQTFKLIKQ